MLYVDSNILIYLLEGTEPYASSIAKKLSQTTKPVVTSTLTITEVIAGNPAITSEHIKRIPRLMFADFDTEIALKAASLKHKHKMPTPDAIHLATAQHLQCTKFFTNDIQLAKITKEYCEIIKP